MEQYILVLSIIHVCLHFLFRQTGISQSYVIHTVLEHKAVVATHCENVLNIYVS